MPTPRFRLPPLPHVAWSATALGLGLAASAIAGPPDDAVHAGLPPAPTSVEFDRDVRPILARRCFVCHGFDPSSRMAGLRLDVRDEALAKAIVPGDANGSLLWARVSSPDPDDRMPPKGPGLTPDELATLRAWIDDGASYAPHWAWQPLRKVAPPDAPAPRFATHPVDRFIARGHDATGVTAAPPVDRATLLRRLSFDLTGLPPDPDVVEAFTGDERPDAYERRVDALLASPGFGEHWARHWLDLVRYAETHGHEFDYPIHDAWPYRDYVIRALNADVPYDDFVREHVAGDLLDAPRLHPDDGTNESVIGTAFWWLGQGTHGPVDLAADTADRIDNQIDVFSKAFLATTVSCARCHDHKFDAIPTRDYYALAGYLRSSRKQRAYLDPGGVIAQRAAELAALQTRRAALLTAALADGPAPDASTFAPWLAAAMAVRTEAASAEAVATERSLDAARLARWVDALAAVPTDDPAHPAFGVVHAGETPPPSPVPSGAWFADFDDSDAYADWFVSGVAFGAGPALPGLRHEPDWLDASGVAHSGLDGHILQGTLRSRTFTIPADTVHLRVRGRGGIVRVVIEGYTLDEFNALLFEGLRVRVDDPDRWRWTTHDLSKYRGHRAHIEVIDDGDGFLAVDAIRFGPLEPAPPAPSAATREAVAARLAGAIAAWHDGALDEPSARALRWLLRHDLWPIDGRHRERLDALARERATLETRTPAPVRVLATADGTGEDAPVLQRGEPHAPGDVVPRRFLTAFGGASVAPETSGSGRLHLADALLAETNPLPARVLVNRVWHHLFGRGLVATPDDFGALGRRPTHPDLLDWLARWFRDDAAWSIKELIRLLVTSGTYRMSSTPNVDAVALDPTNRLWHHHPVKRLTAESLRDAILTVSGTLEPARFGPPVPVHLTAGMTGRGRPGHSGPLDGAGRRSIYLEVRRNFLAPMMLVFDAPTPFTTVGRRSVSNVPAQSLLLMNDPFVRDEANRWATRLLTIDEHDAERIDRMFRTALGRPPDGTERRAALDFLATGPDDEPARRWGDLAHVIFNLQEFAFVR